MFFEESLRNAWRALALNGVAPVDTLRDAYADASRFYHTLDHIEACLWQARDAGLANPRITLAICYHDCVYDTHSAENELLSAEWANRDLENARAEQTDREAVRRLIMATAHREKPVQEDEKILVDIDLSILGAPDETYDGYVRSIRREYAWVTEENFRAGRAKFLRSMLARETLYSTPRMIARLEERARENLRRELSAIDRAGNKAS